MRLHICYFQVRWTVGPQFFWTNIARKEFGHHVWIMWDDLLFISFIYKRNVVLAYGPNIFSYSFNSTISDRTTADICGSYYWHIGESLYGVCESIRGAFWRNRSPLSFVSSEEPGPITLCQSFLELVKVRTAAVR